MGKQKCSYWDKCYRKDKAHKKNFLHPGDTVSDSETEGSDDESTGPVSLEGKRVTFTGAISVTRKQASAEAEEYGCIVCKGVSRKTDIVVVGGGCGKKYDKAEDLGLEVYEESDWRTLLAASKKIPQKEVKMALAGTALKKHDLSESEDEFMFESEKAKKTTDKKTAKKRGACVHDLSSDSTSDTEEDGPTPAKKAKESPPAKAATAKDAAARPKKKAAKRRVKCKYWGKCYQKNATHKKAFAHPSDDDADMAVDDADDLEADAKNELDDGDSAEIKGGLHGVNTFRIKRKGDVYSCTCATWKNQTRDEEKRTCRHLQTHLGEGFEKARVGDTGPGWAGSEMKAKQRAPRHKNIGSLMLAHKWTESTNPKGWWMSEKLDGVRAYWDGKAFYSRLGNEFIPPAWFVADFPSDMELDGELFGGRGKFQSTVSIVKNAGCDGWKNIKYQIFDAPHLMKQPFEKRIEALEKHFEDNDVEYAEVLKHEKCKGEEHLKKELERVEGLGGEGLMIRQPGSKYEHARSKALLKIKTFHDAEALVIGHEKGKGRNSHRCGAITCKMACGKQFSVGTGLSDKDRNSPPKVGSIITYKFQEYTNSGIPRFPVYLGIRIDMSKPKDAVLPAKPSD